MSIELSKSILNHVKTLNDWGFTVELCEAQSFGGLRWRVTALFGREMMHARIEDAVKEELLRRHLGNVELAEDAKSKFDPFKPSLASRP